MCREKRDNLVFKCSDRINVLILFYSKPTKQWARTHCAATQVQVFTALYWLTLSCVISSAKIQIFSRYIVTWFWEGEHKGKIAITTSNFCQTFEFHLTHIVEVNFFGVKVQFSLTLVPQLGKNSSPTLSTGKYSLCTMSKLAFQCKIPDYTRVWLTLIKAPNVTSSPLQKSSGKPGAQSHCYVVMIQSKNSSRLPTFLIPLNVCSSWRLQQLDTIVYECCA